MAFFWFLIVVILLIILSRRSKESSDGGYQQGYWDGYRALGARVQQQLDQPAVDRVALQSAVDIGVNGEVVVAEAEDKPIAVEVDADEVEPDGFVLGGQDIVPRPPAQSMAVPVPPSAAVARELTPQELQRRSLRNLNVILYMASFLLVAAGALFTAAAMPDTVKLIGVWLIVGLFYVTGYVIHRTVVRLRPASVAFLGTGLALVPFAGLALHQYTTLSPELAWLVTSAVGLVAYVVAAIRLQNQFVSYLAMAFVLSLVTSGSAAVSMGLVWQFALLIGVSLIATSIALVRPRWVPAVFSQPIETTGQFVTPLVLVASLFVGNQLQIRGYEIVFALSTIYYLVVWLQQRQMVYETAVRVLASVTALVFAWDIWSGGREAMGLAVLGVATAQLVYSLASLYRAGHYNSERAWLAVAFCGQFVAFMVWSDAAEVAILNVIGLTVLGMSSVVAAVRLRQIAVGLLALAASILAPIIVVRDIIQPSLPWWVLAVLFMTGAIVTLWAYVRTRQRSINVRQFMTLAYISYVIMTLVMMVQQGTPSFTTSMLLVVAVFVVAVSYATRMALVQVISIILLYVVFSLVADQINLATEWWPLFVGGGVALLAYGATWGHALAGERQALRRHIMLASGQVAMLVAALTILSGSLLSTKVAFIVLLVWSVVSLALRIWCGQKQLVSAQRIFQVTYPLYAVAAILCGLMLPQVWLLIGLYGGMVLAVWSSYVERKITPQVVAAGLLFFALIVTANYSNLELAWRPLFAGAGAALLLVVAAGYHALRRQLGRQIAMLISAQVVLLCSLFGGLYGDQLVTRVTFITLLLWACVSLMMRMRGDRMAPVNRILRAAYLTYAAITLVVMMPQLTTVWSVVGLGVVTALAWMSSYAERRAWMILLGNGVLLLLLATMWSWLKFDASWALLGIAGIGSLVFYVGSWLTYLRRDAARSQLLRWSTWVCLGVAGLFELGSSVQSIAIVAAVALAVLAGTLAIEGWLSKRPRYVEVGIYVATFGLQRITTLLLPDVSVIWYAHWWAIAIAVSTLLYQRRTWTRLVVGLILISGSSALFALGDGGWYQLLFLVEHIALLLFGALRSKSWALWWGLAGSALAVVYFLGGFNFLSLGFLGLLMIGIVVWRLLRGVKA